MLGVVGRQSRINFEGGWYHVMNRGADHQTTFFCDSDRVEFGRLLGVGFERYGVQVHAYCLMTNHYHLLLHCPDAGLSEFMQLHSSVFTRHVNERAGRDGPLYRGRFRSIVVTDDNQLVATTRYIHRNALDLPGVDSVDRYRWSSHRTYLGHRSEPCWMRTDTVLTTFNQDRAAFGRFVADERRFSHRLHTGALNAAIDLVLDEPRTQLATAPQGVARTVMILILDRTTDGEDTKQINQVLGFSSRESRASAIRRARRRAAVDRVIELTNRNVHDVSDTS